MRVAKIFAALLGALALPAACGPRGAPEPLRQDHCPVGGCKDASTTVDSGPIEIPWDPLEPWDTTGSGPLSGVFAVETVISAPVGSILVETRQIFRLRILQDGIHLKQKTTLCSFKLPAVPDVATLAIPQKLQALFQTKHVEVEGDFLGSKELVGATWRPTPSLLVVGAKLADPFEDPLPKTDDPKTPEDESATAFDEDDDDHPGVTLDASVVVCGEGVFEQLYVALRTRVKLDGKVVTPDRIEGKANVTLDQSVVGMSDKCLDAAAKINIKVQPGSPFKALRVGDAQDVNRDGNVSCPELAVQAVPLFGEYWAE